MVAVAHQPRSKRLDILAAEFGEGVAETPSGERRTRLIASFNRGYHGFQQTYRTCTPAANVAIKRYLTEGAKISRDLTARYAN